jgi:signal transduction histidine kinase
MRLINWEWIPQLRRLLAMERPEPTQQAARVVAMQRGVVLPSKAGVILVVLYYFFYSGWLYEAPTTRSVVQDSLKHFFLVYVFCNLAGALLFGLWRRLPPGLFQWLAFTLGLLDGLFIAGLAMVTGGFESILFWVFPGLIVLNAISIPLAIPQIVLNLLLSLFFFGAGIWSPHLVRDETAMISVPKRNLSAGRATNQVSHVITTPATNVVFLETQSRRHKSYWSDELTGESTPEEILTEPFLLRVSVLWLLAACCYGAQVLLERQRLAAEEAAEFAARESQIQSAGRLAAEFAHQIKNPLAVINNTAFSLRRSLKNQNSQVAEQQIEIIQEEVARADRVITQIMGYAQLSEGRVEKLDVVETINQAIELVFPLAVPTGVHVQKKFSGPFPPLLMQRGHLSEILVNLLRNAREALGDKGNVTIEAVSLRDYSIKITVADDGPGIAPDKLEQVFEAYFTTKEKGSGLGLAIVKHDAELYGGTVRVDSGLGKGTKFTITFPAKTLPRPILK